MSSAKYLESKDLRKGEELMIFYKDKPIAYCKSMNFSLSVESVDVSSKMSGEWDSTLPGKLSWSYDVDSMVSINPDHLSYDEMCKLAAKRDSFTIKVATVTRSVDPSTGEKTFTVGAVHTQGEVMITDINSTSSAGERDTFSCTLKGAGPLRDGSGKELGKEASGVGVGG